MSDATALIRYACPVCEKPAYLEVSTDYVWTCPTCKATGHWTLHLTAHALAATTWKRAS